MTINDHRSPAERLAGIDEIECVTPDLNGVPRGKVMTAEGFLEGRRVHRSLERWRIGCLVRTPTLISPSPQALQPVFMVLSMSWGQRRRS